MEAEGRAPYVLTSAQQELVERLGIEIDPDLESPEVNKVIDRAVKAYLAKVCKANPALKKGGYILVDGVVRRISQLRDHRAQLSGGGQPVKWVLIFDIENAPKAEPPQ